MNETFQRGRLKRGIGTHGCFLLAKLSNVMEQASSVFYLACQCYVVMGQDDFSFFSFLGVVFRWRIYLK